MEKYQELMETAKKRIGVADHIVTQTFPLVKDSKLLLAGLEHVFLALTNSMEAVLHYERTYKRIPPFQDSFDSRFTMFQTRLMKNYPDGQRYAHLIKEVRDIIIKHRQSPMEFPRKDRFVICNGNYKMKTVSVENMKDYISQTRRFIEHTEGMLKVLL
ncbi:hypothetical protein GOV09_07180 [Candidatus Woesearchaeota archaeon]|nr:hypothetical protein [Candidatus Woesearchaeota archaeon]